MLQIAKATRIFTFLCLSTPGNSFVLKSDPSSFTFAPFLLYSASFFALCKFFSTFLLFFTF
jgi:hypothetical protein